MAKFIKILGLFLLCSAYANGQQQGSYLFDKLKGSWECNTGQGVIRLEFLSPTVLSFDGEQAAYQLMNGALRMNTDYGQFDYPFNLEKDDLVISFPEGYQLLFKRVTDDNPAQAGTTPPAGGTGNNQALFGKFCYWSGSSSSYSGTSSSSTRWAYFDGKGAFSWGSESSFSSQEGIAYGSQGGGENRGTYSVKEKVVILMFPDGSQSQASITMVQNDGRITELTFEGKLYAKALCE
jgi:hypothetical protein